MTTETVSGKCPCCSYEKVHQYYGTGHYSRHYDACPNCGFAYVTNFHPDDDDLKNEEYWQPTSYGGHDLICLLNYRQEHVATMTPLEIRRAIFDWTENHERSDDVETTVLKYTDNDVQSYLDTNPVVFKKII